MDKADSLYSISDDSYSKIYSTIQDKIMKNINCILYGSLCS